jgi:hypothetical protein
MRRLRFHRWVIVASLTLAADIGKDLPTLIPFYLRLWSLERKCEKHPVPPDSRVYSSDNPQAAVVSSDAAAQDPNDPSHIRLTVCNFV